MIRSDCKSELILVINNNYKAYQDNIAKAFPVVFYIRFYKFANDFELIGINLLHQS